MDTYTQHVAGNVRAELARRGVSQNGLADKLGVSGAWVSRRIGGEVSFSIDDLERIADVLAVPVEQLTRRAS